MPCRAVDERLNGEIFYTLREAQIIIEEGRRYYNTKRPHSALAYLPPVPETLVPMLQVPGMHQLSRWPNQKSRLNLIAPLAC